MKHLDRMSLKELVNYRESLSEIIQRVKTAPGQFAPDEAYDELDAIDKEMDRRLKEDKLESQLRYK